MKKRLAILATLTIAGLVIQSTSHAEGFLPVKDAKTGQKIYWIYSDKKSKEPCPKNVWYETWEIVSIENEVAKIRKKEAPSLSWTGEEKFVKLDGLTAYVTEQEAKDSVTRRNEKYEACRQYYFDQAN